VGNIAKSHVLASLLKKECRVGLAAPAHHEYTAIANGGPALEARWSHPTGDFQQMVASVATTNLYGFFTASQTNW